MQYLKSGSDCRSKRNAQESCQEESCQEESCQEESCQEESGKEKEDEEDGRTHCKNCHCQRRIKTRKWLHLRRRLVRLVRLRDISMFNTDDLN